MWAQYGFFVLETLTIVVAILVIFLGLLLLRSAAAKAKKQSGKIQLESLNALYEKRWLQLVDEAMEKKEAKPLLKAHKKTQKKLAKAERPRLFVLDFKGDIQASAATGLREEVTAILQIASPQDQVLVRLESAGGVVHGYGLAASQLERLKAAGIHLIVSIDKVAASGGYMMACVADEIIAAPFAIIGSIGVLAQIPNVHRLLKDKGVDFEQITAGEYKRTLTVFGKNTAEGRKKLTQEIQETHGLFKDMIHQYRPDINMDEVATGEHWFAKKAVTMHLVDQISTSDDFLLQKVSSQQWCVYLLTFNQPRSLGSKLRHQAHIAITHLLGHV